MYNPAGQKDTGAWILFVWLSFGTSVLVTGLGIAYAPVDVWIKGFFAMGLLFTIGSTFTLAKTIRDNAEAQKQQDRVADVKTEKILSEYQMRAGS